MNIWKQELSESEETEQAGEEHMVRKKATTRRKTTTRRKAPAKKKKAKSRVNEAGNYTKPTMRKRLFQRIKAGSKGGAPGQWSARKAQMLARQYKAKGGGYR